MRHLFRHLVVCVLSFVGLRSADAFTLPTIPQVDRTALEAFYDATGGANWITRTNWKDQASAAWYGVVLDPETLRVTSISLPGNNLVGNLSFSTAFQSAMAAGGLSELRSMDISDNDLSGGFPLLPQYLRRMENLDLSRNLLLGAVPSLSEWSRQDNGALNSLHISGNGFQLLNGAFPSLFPDLDFLYAYNAIETFTGSEQDYLNEKEPGGLGLQTLTPSEVTVTAVTSSAFTLAWTPRGNLASTGRYVIAYDDGSDGGGEEVDPMESGVLFVEDLTATAATIGGLLSGTTYEVTIYTVTDPHPLNPGTIISNTDVLLNVTTDPAGPGDVSFVYPYEFFADEGAGVVTVAVTRFGGSSGPISVDVQTVDGSAVAGSDFTALTATLNWADGELGPKTVAIPILQDSLVEGSESFRAILLNQTQGVGFFDADVPVTIADDDEDVPPPVPTVTLADTGDALLFEGQSLAMTVQLSQATTVPVTVAFSADSAFSSDFSNFPNAASITIAAGATQGIFTLSSVEDSVAEAIKTGLVGISGVTNGVPGDSDTSRGIELRDDDADPEPLDAAARGGESVLTSAVVGGSYVLYALDGTPPYQISVSGGAFQAPVALHGAYDLDGDGDNDLGQSFVLIPTAEGAGSITIADAASASVILNFTATALPIATVPPPSLPLSGSGTVYAPLAGGTPQGVAAILALAEANDATRFKAGVWDAVAQDFVQLPDQPTGGLLPSHGIFMATRQGTGLDLSGWPAPLPFAIALYPGWNFIGVPLLDGVTGGIPLGGLELTDEAGIAVSSGDVSGLIGDVAHLWDGEDYVPQTSVLPGKGYWIYNASADPAQALTLTIPSGIGNNNTKSSVSMAAVTDESPSSGYRIAAMSDAPPRPASTQTASSGGGGCGSGFGFILPVLLLLGLVQLRFLRKD